MQLMGPLECWAAMMMFLQTIHIGVSLKKEDGAGCFFGALFAGTGLLALLYEVGAL